MSFTSWLTAQGLPTHLLSHDATTNPEGFAKFLLRSPDSLTREQRRVLAMWANPTEKDVQS